AWTASTPRGCGGCKHPRRASKALLSSPASTSESECEGRGPRWQPYARYMDLDPLPSHRLRCRRCSPGMTAELWLQPPQRIGAPARESAKRWYAGAINPVRPRDQLSDVAYSRPSAYATAR